MNKEDITKLEEILMEEVVKRRKLGGYSMEAEGILKLAEVSLAIVQHLKETMPRSRK